MNYQRIKPVMPYTHYLDRAFSRAKKSAASLESKRYSSDITMHRVAENGRILAITKSLIEDMKAILLTFPNVDDLPEFDNELVKCTLDYPSLKRAFGAVLWAQKKTEEFGRKYQRLMGAARSEVMFKRAEAEFYGRISSIMKQINSQLLFLEQARKVMKEYPNINQGVFIVAIAGFPNVGKSTLLKKLTKAKPAIEAYPFTTKGLNLGFANYGSAYVQYIDTPGTLNRLNKMNNIEKQAVLAIKHLSELVVYVFDLTEPYPLAQQETLLEGLKEYHKKIILYLSKTDILDKQVVASFARHYPVITDIGQLEKMISDAAKEYYRNSAIAARAAKPEHE